MRAAAAITDSEHEPLPYNVEWTQNSRAARVKERRDSSGQRVRRLVHLLLLMQRPSSLTTFFLHFVGFVFFGVTGVVVGVPAMFMLTRDTFSTSFSIVIWTKAGVQFTPSISRVTVDSVSVGFSASGERSWCPVQRRVSFQKARTQNRSLESFQVRRCRMERYKNNDHAFLVGMLFVLMCVWLSAFVCICFVCLSPFESDGPSVCLCPSMSRGRGVCVSLCFF